MTAALAEQVNHIAEAFNASQDAMEVQAIYKGGYADVLTETVAASCAHQAPRLVQIFEVGTGTMLAAGKAVKQVRELAKETGAAIDPKTYIAAVRMDGAGPLRFLRDILIPVSAANIAALFVILFVYGWNQYLWPLLVATDPGLDMIVIGIVKMIGVETQTDWSAVMATAVLALLPPVVVVVLMQRWFVAGLTEGEK
jgi:hypothetical protein